MPPLANQPDPMERDEDPQALRERETASLKALNVKLHFAARHHNLPALRSAAALGADLNAPDTLGWSALHLACAQGSLDCARELIKLGANLNPLTNMGETPLFVSAHTDSLEVAALLLGAGAQMEIFNAVGYTALFVALEDAPRVAMLLLAAGARAAYSPEEGNQSFALSAIHLASAMGRAEIVSELIKQGHNSLHSIESFPPPLNCAAQAEDDVSDQAVAETARVLIAAGADLEHLSFYDACGHTPLMSAVRGERVQCARLLLDAGAEVDVSDDLGESIASIARKTRNPELIALITQSARAKAEKTALSLATQPGESAEPLAGPAKRAGPRV